MSSRKKTAVWVVSGMILASALLVKPLAAIFSHPTLIGPIWSGEKALILWQSRAEQHPILEGAVFMKPAPQNFSDVRANNSFTLRQIPFSTENHTNNILTAFQKMGPDWHLAMPILKGSDLTLFLQRGYWQVDAKTFSQLKTWIHFQDIEPVHLNSGEMVAFESQSRPAARWQDALFNVPAPPINGTVQIEEELRRIQRCVSAS